MKAKKSFAAVCLMVCMLLLSNSVSIPVLAAQKSGISTTSVGSEIQPCTVPGYYRCIANDVNIRTGPGLSYAVVGTLNYGDKIMVLAINNGWACFEVNGNYRYVKSDYLYEFKG